MSNRASKGARPAAANETRPWWVWLDAAPAAWLAVVISAYSVLAMVPAEPRRAPVAGVEAADPLALPFLALTVAAGIIRYVCARRFEQPIAAERITASSTPRDTS
jgi:hypothetical protein